MPDKYFLSLQTVKSEQKNIW